MRLNPGISGLENFRDPGIRESLGLAPLNKICFQPSVLGWSVVINVFTIEEMIKIVATICQIIRLKCTKSFVGWGSASDPAGGAITALLQTPSWILGGLLLRGGEETTGEERDREGREEEVRGKGEGRDGRGDGWGEEGAGSAPS